MSASERAVRVVCDQRETRNPIMRHLDDLGCKLDIVTLPVGDYVVSNESAFEYKTPDDFLSSVVGTEKGKIFGQIGDLVKAYEKPALLIGGSLPGLFIRRNHVNSIFAMLQAIMWQGCPVRFLDTPEIAAQYIYNTAKKEQIGDKREFSPHGKRSTLSPDRQKEYVISSINDVGPLQAKNLLKHFGSVERVMTASTEELMEADMVGEGTARKIRELVGGVYFGGK